MITNTLLESLAKSLNIGGARRPGPPLTDLLQFLATKRPKLHTQEVGGLAGPRNIPGGAKAITEDVQPLPVL